MADKIMLIDGNSIANRAFYGVPALTNSEGRYTNAIYGFLNILFKLLDEEQPKYIAVAFDLSAPTFRHKAFADYKGTRKGMPQELREQMPVLKEILGAMNIKIYELEGFEADDILGTLSKKSEEIGLSPVIVSGDRDLLQLAGENVKIRIPKTKQGKTEIEDYYAKDVLEKYGVTPTEFIDVKALMGDISDNIPGVPGIGEKTAIKIISQFKTVENALENAADIKPKRASENIVAYKELASLSKFLAKINTDVPIELNLSEIEASDMLNPKSYELFKNLEFKSFLNKFEDSAKETPSENKGNYRLILSLNEAEDFLNSIPEDEEIAFKIFEDSGNFTGISFYSDNTGVLIKINDSLSAEELIDKLRNFLSNENYKKITHDYKSAIRLLRKYNSEPGHVIFDTELAAYILNPTKASYEYDDLASELFNEIYPSKEEIFGKGKGRKAFNEIDSDVILKYCCDWSKIIYNAKQKQKAIIEENDQASLYYDIELPLCYVLADMEMYGIKVNKDALIEYGKALEDSINIITKEIYEMAGEEFNLNSPKQIGYILFEKIGLYGSKKNKTGYSTAADVLERMRYEHPIIEKILTFRQLSKLKSTYADGLLAVMDEKTDKIYSTFHQTITATGRISSSEPNLQNIPIRLELGRELRKVFIPESDKYIFLDADYSQIELRILAHISQDETLINAFINKEDIHKITASQVFNVPFDEVTPQQRSNAKAVNFGIIYGIGAFSLSQDLGISRKKAEEYIEGYFAKYPKIKKYMDETIENAAKNGYVSTIYGRRRPMPELKSQNYNIKSFGERVAMNMPIQGTAADIIKIAMIKVHSSLKNRGLKSRLILQVHDELLLEVHKDEINEVTEILKSNMENAAALRVPLDIDIHSGTTWFEAK